MSITAAASGTQTATISTEHTLDTETTAGIYGLHVDLSNLQAGDEVELRVYEKVLSGSTSRLLYGPVIFKGETLDSQIQVMPVVDCVHEIHWTLKQTVGTGRAFDWEVRKLA